MSRPRGVLIRALAVLLPALSLAALPGTSYAVQRSWSHHDGTAETSVYVDDFYDNVFVKWDLVPESVNSASSAALRIYGQAVNCGPGTSGVQAIEGYGPAIQFDPCAVFPTSGFGWGSIPIPLSMLVGQQTYWGYHQFSVWDRAGDHSARYALDTDSDAMTSAYENDGQVRRPVAGEAMWDLVLDGNTPALKASPGAVAFGLVEPGTTSTATPVTLTSVGTADISSVSSVTLSGPHASEFALPGDTCTHTAMPFGATCTVDVTFTPAALGTRTATLTLAFAGGGSKTVALTGEGRSLPPVSTITTAGGATLLQTDTVTGTVTDDVGMGYELVTFRPVHPSLATVTTRATLSCDATATSCTWSVPAFVTPGPYTVTATGIDRQGIAESPAPSISVLVL